MTEKLVEQTGDDNSLDDDDDVFGSVGEISPAGPLSPGEATPAWVLTGDSVFSWLPTRFPDVPAGEILTRVLDRIQSYDKFEGIFPFEKLVCYLISAYEYSHQGDQEKASDQLVACEQLFEEEKDRNLETYNQLKEGLCHVLQSTKACLLYRSGKTTQAKQITDSLPSPDSLTREAQAAVAGMKARFFYQYWEDGARLAVQFAKQALSLAPDQPLWQVITAQCIRRLRKFQPMTGKVSSEEISLLEQAVKTQRNARHLLLLAEVYREQADMIFKTHRSQPDFFHSETFNHISDMQAKAFELYKEALILKPNEEIVNRLCGYGLLKLPAFKSDYRLAHRCLQKALELAPGNSTTIHAIGLYYYKSLLEYDRAALFCEKAGKLGNFPASLDMLRMKHLVYGKNYDPVFDFRKLLQQYGEERSKRHEVLCQMGSYSLFFERKLSKALKYFRILTKEGGEVVMTSHKCTFLNMACKINLFECIINEGSRLLQERNSKTVDKSDLEDVTSFLDELRETQPDLFKKPVNPNMIDDLHRVSDEIKQTYMRKKERRESLKEKRRSSSSRKLSVEEREPSRRHSEGGSNARFKNTGSISEWTNHRNTKQTTRHSVSSFSSTPETLNKVSLDKNHHEGQKSGVYKSTNVGGNSGAQRRRNSGGNCDMLRGGGSFADFRRQMSEGVPQKIPEVELPQRKTSQVGPARNSTPWYKRTGSWNGKVVTETPLLENWRKEGKKVSPD